MVGIVYSLSSILQSSPTPPSWGRSLYHRWRLGWREEMLTWTKTRLGVLLVVLLLILFWCTLIAETLLRAFNNDVMLLVLNTVLFISWCVCVCLLVKSVCDYECGHHWEKSSLLDVSNANAGFDGHSLFYSPCKMSTKSNRIQSQQMKSYQTFCWYYI